MECDSRQNSTLNSVLHRFHFVTQIVFCVQIVKIKFYFVFQILFCFELCFTIVWFAMWACTIWTITLSVLSVEAESCLKILSTLIQIVITMGVTSLHNSYPRVLASLEFGSNVSFKDLLPNSEPNNCKANQLGTKLRLHCRHDRRCFRFGELSSVATGEEIYELLHRWPR